MKQIWKFPLGAFSDVTLKMPKGAEIIECHTQNGEAMLWAVVDPENETEERTFITLCTGQPFTSDNKKYIGTYQVKDGTYILHVFEIV